MIKKFEIFESIHWWKNGKLGKEEDFEEEDFEEEIDDEYVKKILINRLKKVRAQIGNLHGDKYDVYSYNYQKTLELKREEENILKKLEKLK